MTDQANGQRSSRAKNVALWLLQILTAAAFLMAGFAKLSGQPMMVETFDKIGLGQWFRYLTGSLEVASAILLGVTQLSSYRTVGGRKTAYHANAILPKFRSIPPIILYVSQPTA